MAIKQIMWRIRRGAGMMGDDHRMAGRVAQAGIKAEPAQFVDKPLTGAAAVRRIGRIGGNGGNAQQPEQAH